MFLDIEILSGYYTRMFIHAKDLDELLTPTMHRHDATCIGGTELNEMCCSHLLFDSARLHDADRYVVTHDDGTTTHVFTDVALDACALALCVNESPVTHVTFDPQPDPYTNQTRDERIA